MQKLKKAFKKLATLGASKGASKAAPKSASKKSTGKSTGKKPVRSPINSVGGVSGARSGPAQAAKKAAPTKKKSQTVATAKKAMPAKKSQVKKGTEKQAAAAPPKSIHKGAPKGEAVANGGKQEVKDQKKKAAAPAAAAPKAVQPVTTPPLKEADKAKKQVGAVQVRKNGDTASTTVAVTQQATLKTDVIEAEELELKARARKPKEEPQIEAEPEEVVLTDAEGRRYCRVKECDQIAAVDTYCRYHYLLFWKNIQVRKKILTEGKLERYIEELTARYPDKYLEMLRKDLRNEKDFMAAIQELEIDEASVDNDYEDEAQNYLDEVRGMSSETPTRDEEDY